MNFDVAKIVEWSESYRGSAYVWVISWDLGIKFVKTLKYLKFTINGSSDS